jgi:hypothetical protein
VTRALLLFLFTASPPLSPLARAEGAAVLARFRHEPTVAALQRAAARLAEVQPERVRSWLHRVRAAAAMPSMKVRVGHGAYGYVSPYGSTVDGAPTAESWRVEAEVGWSLDRLIFDRDEIGLARESQRLAARRELLLTEVAQLYFARRRLQVEATSPPADEATQVERQLAIDELTAVLDGLTDGALTKGTVR